ncbi:hypothetical protein BKA18_006227 [Streptomyces auratus]
MPGYVGEFDGASPFSAGLCDDHCGRPRPDHRAGAAGLIPDELRALLGPLAASPRCAGVNVTIYDPDRDPEGSGAVLLADLLEDVFAQP